MKVQMEQLNKRLDDMEKRYIARYKKVKKGSMPVWWMDNNVKLIKDFAKFMRKGIKLFLEK